VQTYTVTRAIKKKNRDESLPSHLRRVEKVIEASDAQMNCSTHGARKIIGYDRTETLVYTRPELHVLVKKYPKYVCPGHPDCGVVSPERPPSLVEGDRYDTSVAAAVVKANWFHHLPIYRHQDVFAGSGWMPSRSTLLNLVNQVQFVNTPLIAYMTRLVQQDVAVGLGDRSCRMLLPKTLPTVIPGDDKSRRLAEKVAEARAKGDASLPAKMGVYSGLHLAPYKIFDFRASRHRDGPDDFFRTSRCTVQGDCFSGNLSVVLNSEERLLVCGVAGGEQSAMMLTLVSNARRHDLDVGVYVKDVLDQLLAGSTDYHCLLPDVWKQSHPEAIREYRVAERRDKAERKQLQAARRRLAARHLR
jgi:transposase